MANYYGSGRSNYVTVTDKEKWKELCNKFDLEFIEDSGKVGFLATNEEGDIPCYMENPEESQDDIEVDPLADFFCKLLADDEVLIFQTVGYEKLRYLVGYATAINNKGEFLNVSLDDIYEKSKTLGKNITTCQY